MNEVLNKYGCNVQTGAYDDSMYATHERRT